jgi:prevent-host-death family protein
MDVGVRELKQRLSEYLRLVESGATIRVTDRGVPKAVLMPLRGVDRIQVGVEEGWIRPATRPHRIGQHPRQPSARRTSELVREDRGE